LIIVFTLHKEWQQTGINKESQKWTLNHAMTGIVYGYPNIVNILVNFLFFIK